MADEMEDPYLGFRFHVELEGVIVAGFSEVHGLGVELLVELIGNAFCYFDNDINR